MRLRRLCLLVLPLLIVPFLAVSAYADSLGPALDPFAVLAGTSVTNAGVGVLGATVITGSLGVSPGTSITGFPPGTVVSGSIENNTGAAAAAQLGLTAAIGNLNSGGGITIGAGGLSGASLAPGVYNVTSSATFDMLTGSTLTLTGPGMYVFRMSSTLTLPADVTIDVSTLDSTSSLYWLAPGPTTAVTLGKNDDFEGNVLTNGSITFDTGATVGCGRVLSQNKLVSFAGQNPTTSEENLVGGGCTGNLAGSGGLNGGGGGPGPVPEPATLSLLGSGFAGLLGMAQMKRRANARKA